ncbi:MAG TPA: hypothetical protein VKP30_25115, partial [Polyangiaceae bacterium]|nr:hypothetical protein [Polyangiaceae bacterium]
WRPSWKEWLRADQVRVLRKALGRRARDFKDPILDTRQQTPPPIPESDGEDDWSPRRSTPVLPPNDHPKALVRRPAQPTITDLTAPVSTGTGGTLRPPGAVPPPPRGVPRALLGDSEAVDGAVEFVEPPGNVSHHPPSISNIPGRSSTPVARPSTKQATDGTLEPSVDLPPEELSAPDHPSHAEAVAYDPDSIETRQAVLDLRPLRAPETSSRRRRAIGLVLAFAALTASTGFWLTLRHPSRATTVPRPSTQPAPSSTVTVAGCVPSRPAQRIAPSLLMSIAPIAAEATTTGKMLVGFAENATTAVGISVDPNDLDLSIPFREENESRVVSVTPLGSYGLPQFFASRESLPLRKGRLVDASRDFLFGLSDTGFSRQIEGGEVDPIWAVDAKANVTDPRISSISGLAHAITFRRGGQTGTIMLGWLTESGQSLAGPYQLQSEVEFVGTPTLATSSDSALVAFAGRATESAPWSLFLSEAKVGHPPTPAKPIAQPTGGPGGDSISPALISIPEHRWLLQWSEGSQGQRQVRIQTLDSNTNPTAVPHTVSPLGSNSGQGLLWSSGRTAVSLFVVSVGRSAELWATPLTCPE